jgi:hypothetical protein
MTLPLLCKYVNRFVYGYEPVPVAHVPDVPLALLIELEPPPPPSTHFGLTFESNGVRWGCTLSLQMDGDTPVAFNFLAGHLFGEDHYAPDGRVVKNGSDRYFKCEHDYYTIFTTLRGGEDTMLLECVYIPCTREWILPIGVRFGLGHFWDARFYGCEVQRHDTDTPHDPPSCVCDRYIKMPV